MANITYKLATQVADDAIYEAFMTGFSDYIIKLQMEKEQFFDRFFGPEGNTKMLTHVAFDDDLPVGVLLGGIRDYDGLKTLRCGALCIHPDYRGMDVGLTLMARHTEDAKTNACGRMMLEVIAGNDRAIKFYDKLGYDTVYFIHYFSHKDIPLLAAMPISSDDVVPIRLEHLYDNVKAWASNYHINWQNDFAYIMQVPDVQGFAILVDEKIVAFICLTPQGRLFRLLVHPEHQNKGYGKQLLVHVARTLKPSALHISVSSSGPETRFLRKLGFGKDSLYQFEMIK